MNPWKPLVIAAVASAAALAGAAELGAVLRRQAAIGSHALPTAGRTLLDPHQVTPTLVKEGSTLFLNNCAHCHGNDAHGDEGPDLHGLDVSDRRIATVVMRGIHGEMPSFSKKLKQDDVLKLIAYLRTLD